MKNLSIRLISISIFLWLSGVSFLMAQGKFNITTGAGLPELINVGVRYQYQQLQLGASLGSGGKGIISYTADLFYPIGTLSDIPKKNPWYGRLGYSFIRAENEYNISKNMTLQARFGKFFELNSRMRIGLDIGLMFKIYADKKDIKPKPVTGWNIHFDLGVLEYVLPSGGLHFYYQL